MERAGDILVSHAKKCRLKIPVAKTRGAREIAHGPRAKLVPGGMAGDKVAEIEVEKTLVVTLDTILRRLAIALWGTDGKGEVPVVESERNAARLLAARMMQRLLELLRTSTDLRELVSRALIHAVMENIPLAWPLSEP